MAEDILKRHERLKSERAPFEKRYRDIARILRPDDDFFDPRTVKERDDAEVFDSSPLYAQDNFVGGIYSQLTNPTNRWFELSLADEDLAQWGPVRGWLWRQTTRLLKSLAPAVSSFYAEAPAWFADVGAFGFGTLGQEELIGQGRLVDRTAPLRQIYVDTDPTGEVDTIHNEFVWTGAQMMRFFGPRAPANVREDGTYVNVHACAPNPDHRPDRLGWPFKRFAGTYVSPDFRSWRVDGGYDELPYHVIQWNRISGRKYPTGPGHTARADMLMLQEMERSHLVAAQFAAEPPLLQKGEHLSAADIVPNALLDGTMTERGEALVQALERKQELRLSEAKSEQKRNAIREAFLFSIMQLLQRPQMTATEFLGFQAETLKLMAPGLTRVQIGLSGFIARRFAILARAGAIEPPPPELEGQAATVEYVSPLAKVQKLEEGRAALQFQQAVEQMAVTDPEVRDNFNGDVAIRVVHGSLYAAPDLVRDPRQVQQIRERRAREQAELAALEKGAQAVEIAAEASHAAQAATLAGDRGQR